MSRFNTSRSDAAQLASRDPGGRRGRQRPQEAGRAGRSRLARAATFALESLESRTMMAATPLYWDPSGAATAAGGAGTWDAATVEWRSGSPTGTLVAWANAGDANGPYQAVFSAGSGTVTLGVGVTASSVSFTASGYTLSGGNALTLAGGTGHVDVASGATETIAAPVAGTVGLTKTNAGKLTLSGSNTYSGGTTLAAGTLDVTSDAALGAVPSSTSTNITFSGTASLQAGAASVSLAGQRGISIAAGVTATLDTQSNTLIVNGPISNAASTGVLAKGGTAGTLVLAGSDSFVGGTTVSMGGGTNVGAGTLELANSGALGTNAITVDAHNVTNNAAATLLLAGGVTVGSNVTYLVGGHQPSYNDELDSVGGNNVFNGTFDIDNAGGNYAVQSTSGTLTFDGTVTIGFSPSSARQLVFEGAANGVIGVTIAGDIAPVFAGPGTWTVNATQTYYGATTVNGGTLSLNVDQPQYGTLYSIWSNGSITVNSGGTLLASNINALTGYGNNTTSVVVNPGGTLANRAGYTNHIVNLTLAGGTLASSAGSAAYPGFDVQPGDVVNVTANSTITGPSLAMEAGASFQVAAGDTLQATGSIISTGVTSGVAQITKTGPGTMVLAGSNTFAGAITVDAGTLAIGAGGVAVAGTLDLAGGTLSDAGPLYVGSSSTGSGSYVQTGGTATVAGNLIVGMGAPGTVAVSGGTLAVAANAYVGYSANGTLAISGTGAVTDANTLYVSGDGVAGDPAGVGTVDLSGNGSLTTQQTYVGYSGPATFDQTGGTDTAQTLVLDGPSGRTATYQVTGGTVAVGVALDAYAPTAAGPGTVNEGATYTLGLLGTTSTNHWAVNWGDGSAPQTVTSSSATHTYGTAGSYTVTATAYDGSGTASPATTIPVLVNDVAATVLIGGQTSTSSNPVYLSGRAGQAISLSATFTDPGATETHTALVNWGDGTSSTATVTESGGTGTITASHVYHLYGPLHAVLTVTDSGGATASVPFAVEVAYVVPTLSISTTTNVVTNVIQPVTLTLHDAGPEAASTIDHWTLDWGDGSAPQTITSPANTANPSDAVWTVTHTYATAGSYTVTATATDIGGDHATNSVTFAVGAAVPAPASGLTATGNVRDGVTLNWTDNSNNETGFKVLRSSDGGASYTLLKTTAANVVSYTDDAVTAGATYSYEVVATNAAGDAAADVLNSFTVLLPPPTVSPLTVSSAISGSDVTVTAIASPYQNNGDPLTYQWTLVDLAAPSNTVTQTTSGPSLTYALPAGAAGMWSVSLTVTDADAAAPTTVTQQFAVVAPTPLTISGPTLLDAGGTGNYSVTGTATNGVAWTVTNSGGTVVATGSGTAFAFTTDNSGAYAVAVTGTDSSGASATTSVDLTVAQPAPAVSITGPALGFVGKSLTFAADATAGGGETVDYHWTLLNGDGSPCAASALAGGSTTLSTVVVPGSLPAGDYRVQVTASGVVNGEASGSATQTFDFSVLADPSSTGFSWGGLPTVAASSPLRTDAAVRLPDGRIAIAGFQPDSTHGPADASDAPSSDAFIAMFNADLTLDTAFGLDHTGLVALPYSYTAWETDISDIYAMAYNPTNSDLVLVGEADGSGYGTHPALAVAEYTTQTSVLPDGRMVLPGTPEPRFNPDAAGNGQPLVMQSATTLSVGLSVAVMPSTGAILVGGMEVTDATQDEVNAVNTEYGLSLQSPGQLPVYDSLLLKLTPSGHLDQSFGANGVAQQPDFTGLAASVPFDDSDPSNDLDLNLGVTNLGAFAGGVEDILPQPDGTILVGGSVDRSDGLGPNYTGPSYNGAIAADVGFALARYNANGLLDTSFGDGGKTFTPGPTVDGTKANWTSLATMETLNNGDILAAGIASPGLSWYGPTDGGHVVLATYTPQGVLVPGGMIVESTLVDNSNDKSYLNSTGDEPAGLHADDAGMVFQPDDKKLIATLYSGDPRGGGVGVWSLVRINPDGTIDGSFGNANNHEVTVPTPGTPASGTWSFNPDQRSSAMVLDGDSIIATGMFEGDTFAVGNMQEPLVVRYGTSPVPAAANLAASASPAGPVTLTWSDAGYGADGFQVERTAVANPGESDWTLLASVGPNQDDYLDAGVGPGATYSYRIVPFSTGVGGTITTGTATATVAVQTWPSTEAGYQLQNVLAVPTDGTGVSVSLASGETYLLVASGGLPLQSGYAADAAYWYSTTDPKAYGRSFGGVKVGVSLTDPAAGIADAVPDWGPADPNGHTYTLPYVGRGDTLTFQFNAAAYPAAGSTPLQIEVWAQPRAATQPPAAPALPPGMSAFQVSVPGADGGATPPVLSFQSAIDVAATASNGSPVPWTLTLVGPDGSQYPIGSSNSGSAPVLDPADYPTDGIYTLRLTTALPSPATNYSTTLTLALERPVVRIVSPGTVQAGLPPVIDSNTPVKILVASPDGTPTPWTLALVAADGSVTPLASGLTSAGNLPGQAVQAVVLDPALYLNGTYTLRLSTALNGQSNVTDQQLVDIETMAKVGNLSLPATDATVATATGTVQVSRTYDTDQLQSPDGLPGFGPGWTFDLIDAHLTTTARADTFDYGAYLPAGSQLLSESDDSAAELAADESLPVLRAGDLVSLTVPDGGRQVFEFAPVPITAQEASAGNPTGMLYAPRFVALNGSGAVLTVPNFKLYFGQAGVLVYDAVDDEYLAYESRETDFKFGYGDDIVLHSRNVEDVGFNPAKPAFGNQYQLTEADGTSYVINATTGLIESSSDQSGNTTTYAINYTYAADGTTITGGTVTATGPNGQTLLTAHLNGSSAVTSVDVPGQASITYTYDTATGNLTSVTNQAGSTTAYAHNFAGNDHYLTGVTNAAGAPVLQVRYDPTTDQLSAIVDAAGVAVPVYGAALGTDEVVQTVVDQAGDVTQDVYGERYGTLDRTIQDVTDGSGNTSYVVTVTGFTYATDDAGDMSALSPSGVVVLQGIQTYPAFEVAANTAGWQYSQQPDPNSWTKQVLYNTSDDPSNPASGQLESSSERLTAGGDLQTTLFSDFEIVNTTTGAAKPQVTTVELQVFDPNSATGYDDQVQSTTYDGYNGQGNPTYALTVVGRNVAVDGYPSATPTLATGGFPAALYITLNGTATTLAWVQSAGAYTGSAGGVTLTLADTSLAARAAGSMPVQGDAWTLSASNASYNNNDGLLGSVAGLAFDGLPLGLQQCCTALLAGSDFADTVTGAARNSGGITLTAAELPQTLAWTPSSGLYTWATTLAGHDIQLTLTDTSMAARGPASTPMPGDAWTLRVAGTAGGGGTVGTMGGLAFDGTPRGLQRCFAALMAGTHFADVRTGAPVSNGVIGLQVPGWIATGTYTDYDGSGFVADTRSVIATIDPDGTVETPNITTLATTSSQVNYNQSDATTGAIYGAPKYTIDANGQETYYAYDQAGHTILQYVYKQWTTDAGATVSGWVGTTSVYDSAGRLTDTYQATYLDGDAGSHNPDARVQTHTLHVVAGGPAGIQVDTSADPVYQGPLLTQHIDYNTLGQKADTVDQYGGVTTYTYDANGNVVKTVNPDGTETLSVYDVLNRVIWQTSSYLPGAAGATTAADPGLTKHTVYNQLGQVTETDQYAGTLITITSKQLGSSVTATGVLTTAGTLVSKTTTAYDAQGNAIETETFNPGVAGDPVILRTGSVYTPDGKVLYTGPLAASAPDGGHTVTIDDGVSTQAYTTADFASYTETDPVEFDSTLGFFYTRSVDQDGNATLTYTDSQGRTVRTVYADGSFTETLYSVGTTAVTLDSAADTYPDGWTGITGGGYEVVNVAQRKATDTPVYSYDLYNAAGQLTDVWLAKVVDGDPTSPTYQMTVNPHWSYGYDTAGNETTQLSAGGHTTIWAYDQNGNKVSQLLPDGELQTWTYDVYGNNTSHKVYSATDHTTALQTTLDTYDTSAARGGRLLVEDRYASDQAVGTTATPDEQTTYTYDDAATLPPAEQTDQGNVAEVDDYALEGGSLQLTDFTHYTYDPISGNQATITTADGTIHYVYDEASGNLVETWTAANAAAARSSAQNDAIYGYDAQGRLKSVTQVVLNGSTPPAVPGGTRYDADGDAIATTEPTTVYTYDAAGNLLSDAEPNGDTTAYTYNDLNQVMLEVITDTNTNEPIFREQTGWYHNGQKSGVVDTRYNADGSTASQITYAWTYDADNRLAGETLTVQAGSGSNVPAPYVDSFQYDLDNNRTQETEAPAVGQAVTETIGYSYNGDDQLTTETGSGASTYTTHYSYDANGNLSGITRTGDGAAASTYGYNLTNNMTSATVAGIQTAYTYDYQGVLVSEATTGVTTYYLNDPNNPTGNSKAIQESLTPGGAPTTSYVLGLEIEVQSNGTASGMRYLLVDGHGSTRALADKDGAVVSGQTFDYDAFGKTLTNAATAQTTWLFGGDGVYDHATGWTYQLARWRNGFQFTSYDTFAGMASDPASLNKYGYADTNPVMGVDPTGHDDGSALTDEAFDEIGGVQAEDIAGYEAVDSYVHHQFGDVVAYANAGFAVGDFAANSLGLDVQAMTAPLGMVGGEALGAASELLTDGVNSMLAAYSEASSAASEALSEVGEEVSEVGEQVAEVAEECGLATSCFVAGTTVLLGDRMTEEAIQDISVGDRVATDGGAANSMDGKTSVADPNATLVDPATWREVTIVAGDWDVQTLEPLSWIAAYKVMVGGSLDLNAVVDLQEMGVPTDMHGTVKSITACPTIQLGPGRVVTTTVNHLNDDVYNLTLEDMAGKTETLGVTGTHRFYDLTNGWVQVQNLYSGEVLEGAHGNVTVTGLVQTESTDRVYNMTVETDHVYYAGQFDELVHNDCNPLRIAMEAEGEEFGENDQAHHIVAQNSPDMREARNILEYFGIDIHDANNGAVLDKDFHLNSLHNDPYRWAQYVQNVTESLQNASTREGVIAALREIAETLEGGAFP